ncbi:MAG: hypothetical protein GX335_07570 [Firmicutes bacterium]|nr:hypothetical protein [Bacillota bacterium]
MSKQSAENKLLLSILIAVLVLGMPFFKAEANAVLDGELKSLIRLQTSSPRVFQAEQNLLLNWQQYFKTGLFHIALDASYQWPGGEGTLALDQAYFDYYGGNFDLRLGRQRFLWGTALQINPSSILNPPNPRDPWGAGLPVYGLNLDYYPWGPFQLTAVYLPFFRPALEAIPGQPQIPVEIPEPVWEEGQFALKLAALGIGGTDFSLSYFRGRENLPTLHSVSPPQASYREVQIAAADLATAWGDLGIWAEGAAYFPKGGDPYFQAILGGEYGFRNGLLLWTQYLQGRDKSQKTQKMLFCGAQQTFALWEWRLASLYNLDQKGYLFNPELSFSLAEAAVLSLGARYFGKDPLGPLPPEENSIYAQVKVSF